MTITVLTETKDEPVTLEEVRNFLKIETDDEDSVLKILIRAARQQLEQQLGITFLLQEYLFQYCQRTPCLIKINQYPIDTIKEISLKNNSGSEIILEDKQYDIIGVRPAKIAINDKGNNLPRFPRLVEVKFVSGYTDQSDIPETLKLAILKLVSHNYEFRDVSPDINGYQLPTSVSMLVRPYQVMSL